jgi:hypothetical protein
MPGPAAPGVVVPPPYKAKTGNEFLLKTGNKSWSDASKDCNSFGGHLATYVSRAEQIEVRPAPASPAPCHAMQQQGGHCMR